MGSMLLTSAVEGDECYVITDGKRGKAYGGIHDNFLSFRLRAR